MNITIWEKIAGIPWWVYIAAAYILYVQCMSLKPRTISLANAALPILAIISLSTGVFALQLTANQGLINWQMNVYLFGAVMTGMLLGWLQFKLLRIQFITASREIFIPGSWINILLSLLSIISMVAIKYYYGTDWLTTPTVALLSCAFLTGLAGGRLTGMTKIISLN